MPIHFHAAKIPVIQFRYKDNYLACKNYLTIDGNQAATAITMDSMEFDNSGRQELLILAPHGSKPQTNVL